MRTTVRLTSCPPCDCSRLSEPRSHLVFLGGEVNTGKGTKPPRFSDSLVLVAEKEPMTESGCASATPVTARAPSTYFVPARVPTSGGTPTNEKVFAPGRPCSDVPAGNRAKP